jgi:hypothetical protein
MTLNFYIGKDNSQVVKLSDDSSGVMAPSVLNAVTDIILEVGELTINEAQYFSIDAVNSEITITIGAHPNLVVGVYDANLTLIDPTNPNGIQWNPCFKVKVHD